MVVVTLADADCEICEALGFRTCDLCGGLVYRPHLLLGDVCAYCAWPTKVVTEKGSTA